MEKLYSYIIITIFQYIEFKILVTAKLFDLFYNILLHYKIKVTFILLFITYYTKKLN